MRVMVEGMVMVIVRGAASRPVPPLVQRQQVRTVRTDITTTTTTTTAAIKTTMAIGSARISISTNVCVGDGGVYAAISRHNVPVLTLGSPCGAIVYVRQKPRDTSKLKI